MTPLAAIVRAARDPRLRVEDVERCIAAYPELTAEVVRIADSRLFGMQGRIHSLTRALLLLGAERVCVLAAVLALRAELRDEAWLHCLEIATCSELLAGWLGLRLERDVFLAGLLHTQHAFPDREAATRLDPLLRAAHALASPCDGFPDHDHQAALAALDLWPDDAAEVRAELAERLKEWIASF